MQNRFSASFDRIRVLTDLDTQERVDRKKVDDGLVYMDAKIASIERNTPILIRHSGIRRINVHIQLLELKHEITNLIHNALTIRFDDHVRVIVEDRLGDVQIRCVDRSNFEYIEVDAREVHRALTILLISFPLFVKNVDGDHVLNIAIHNLRCEDSLNLRDYLIERSCRIVLNADIRDSSGGRSDLVSEHVASFTLLHQRVDLLDQPLDVFDLRIHHCVEVFASVIDRIHTTGSIHTRENIQNDRNIRLIVDVEGLSELTKTRDEHL